MEVVGDLGEDTRPVDAVDCSQLVSLVDLGVVEERLNDVLFRTCEQRCQYTIT
jgi:hypothetical protein